VKDTENELEAIERAYPKFTGAVHRRYLTLVALGLVEAEYRRHLTEATISIDVFEDLDTQRRVIAARFTRRPELEQKFDTKSMTDSFPFIREFPALRSCVKPYLAFPGQRVTLIDKKHTRAYLILFGRIEAQAGAGSLVLGAGDFFAQSALFGPCQRVTTAVSVGYANLLEIDWQRLDTLMKAYPALKMRRQLDAVRA
jgi:hypothetical protein